MILCFWRLKKQFNSVYSSSVSYCRNTTWFINTMGIPRNKTYYKIYFIHYNCVCKLPVYTCIITQQSCNYPTMPWLSWYMSVKCSVVVLNIYLNILRRLTKSWPDNFLFELPSFQLFSDEMVRKVFNWEAETISITKATGNKTFLLIDIFIGQSIVKKTKWKERGAYDMKHKAVKLNIMDAVWNTIRDSSLWCCSVHI